jgi:ABC-type transporter Mla subunit MlaD
VALAIHDDRLTRRVGAAVLLVTLLVVGYVVFIRDSLQREGTVIRLHFGVVVGLTPGSPVRVAGREIGEVRAIGIARGGGVTVELVIDRGWARQIPINADFFIDAVSPLAPRFVTIGPPLGGAEPGRPLRDGDDVTGADPPSLDRVLQRTYDNLEEVRRFLDALRPATAAIKVSAARLATTVRTLDPHPGAQAEMRAAVAVAAGRALTIVEGLEAGAVDLTAIGALAGDVERMAAGVETTVAELRAEVARMQAALGRVEVARSLGPELSGRLARTLADAERVLADAERLSGQVRAVLAEATTGGSALAGFAADLELIDDVRELTKALKRNPWRVMPPPVR